MNNPLCKMVYKGKPLTFDRPVKSGICAGCGDHVGQPHIRYTILHHFEYDDNDPLAHTVELCPKCHVRVHALMRGNDSKPPKVASPRCKGICTIALHRRKAFWTNSHKGNYCKVCDVRWPKGNKCRCCKYFLRMRKGEKSPRIIENKTDRNLNTGT